MTTSFDINSVTANSFPQTVTGFERLETHISWVFLTGEFAYKIKKPVKFAFCDYSTVEKREHYCHLELKLNQKLAKDIYLEVVPIRVNNGQIMIDGKDGEIVEHALKMRQFEQSQLFNNLCKYGKITTAWMRDIADQLAEMHMHTEIAPADSDFGTPAVCHEPVTKNFIQARPYLRDEEDLTQLQNIEQLSNELFEKLKNFMLMRKQQGWIRACHGDVHLGNTALINNRPVIFDCVEFNENFRWIDVISEIAFMFMDLLEHDRLSLAYIFLNEYLCKTGDYEGLKLLSYYLSYRAMVRAKIQLFALDRPNIDDKFIREQITYYRKYARLAEKSLRPPRPHLFVMNGISGSGKSTYANYIAEDLCAIQIRSDVERKRIIAAKNLPMYAQETNDLIYEILANTAKQVLSAGYSVVLDATYLKHDYRKHVVELAYNMNVPITFIHCEASVEFLHAAIDARKEDKNNVSDATKQTVTTQLENHDPLSHAETKLTLTIQTDQSVSRDEFLILLKNFIEKNVGASR